VTEGGYVEKPDPDKLEAKFRGEDAGNFKEWIQQNLIFPPDALKKGIYGDLLVQYTITPEGRIADVTLLKGKHPLLDAEAIRVVQSSPEWEPAKKAGQNTEQRNIIIVSFKNPSADTGLEKQDVTDNEPAFVFVEVNAAFRDGDINTFRNWVQQHLIYPPEAIEKNINGRVTAQFCVDSYGKVVEVKVLRSPDPVLNAETIRAINSSPKWIPAMQGGKFVKQMFVIPVNF
jgi:TonB family protein